jgi:hypothetical protein
MVEERKRKGGKAAVVEQLSVGGERPKNSMRLMLPNLHLGILQLIIDLRLGVSLNASSGQVITTLFAEKTSK